MIGRQKEIDILAKTYASQKPELVAVFGRRRVGKTYLIGSFFEGKIDFELTGLKDGTKEQQLRNFAYSLKDAQNSTILPPPPMDWLEAFHHIDNIKAALGIAGVHTNQYSFLAKTTEENEGAQIDLLIDRQDNVISLCEVKFYNDELVLSKANADDLRRKKSVFRHVTGTKKQIFIVLVTTFGLIKNKHSLGMIDNVLDMNALF